MRRDDGTIRDFPTQFVPDEVFGSDSHLSRCCPLLDHAMNPDPSRTLNVESFDPDTNYLISFAQTFSASLLAG